MTNSIIIPAADSAERAILGAILADGNCFFRVADRLSPDDFYSDQNRAVWNACVALARDGQAIDLLTLSNRLERMGTLEAAGGIVDVSGLGDRLPDPANVEYYADIARDCTIRRRLVRLGQRLIHEAPSVDAKQLLAGVEQEIMDASAGRQGTMQPISTVLGQELPRIEKISKDGPQGVKTGWIDLDRFLVGLEPQDLILIAARPGVGKSAFALNLVTHNPTLKTVFFSAEMSASSQARRLLSHQTKIPHGDIRRGRLQSEDWQKLVWAEGKIGVWNLWVDDSAAPGPLDILSRSRCIQMQHGLDLVLVDYLQLMGSGSRRESRVQEVSAISAGLKACAKQLNVPLIALSQLSRNPEHRQDRRPVLSDLRDSGSLEQDADVVIFLNPEQNSVAGTVIEVVVAKQRNGPVGSCKLTFLKETLRFENYAGEENR